MIGLGVLVLIGLSGCSKSGGSGGSGGSKGSKEKNIVGKWQQVETENEPQIIEFLEDERVLIYDLKDINKKEEKGLPGDYRFIDENRIRMNLALFGPITAEVSSSKNEITLTNPFGKVEKYRRSQDRTEVKLVSLVQEKDLKKNILGKYSIPTEKFMEVLLEKGTGFGEKYLEFKNDGSLLFSESGSDRTWQGKWEIVPLVRFSWSTNVTYYVSGKEHKREEEIKSFEGEIRGDTISMQMVMDFPEVKSSLPTSPPWINQLISKDCQPWVKQKGADLIERLEQKNTIWSEYTHPETTFNFKLQKNGISEMVFSGKYRITKNIVTFYDPRGKVESIELKIGNDSLVFESGVLWIKQENARVICRTNEGTLWNQYRGPDVDNTFLRLEKNDSLNSGCIGNWTKRAGIICQFEDKEWKLEFRDDGLIDKDGNNWEKQTTSKAKVQPKTVYDIWTEEERKQRDYLAK